MQKFLHFILLLHVKICAKLVNIINAQDLEQTIIGYTTIFITAAQFDHGLDIFLSCRKPGPIHIALQILEPYFAVAVPVHNLTHILHHPSDAVALVPRTSPAAQHAFKLIVLHEPILIRIRHRHHGPDRLLISGDAAWESRVKAAEIFAADLAVAVGVEDVECRAELRPHRSRLR